MALLGAFGVKARNLDKAGMLQTIDFLGEMVLANQFAAIRTPCWNDDIIHLAHDIEHSALTNSWQLNRVPEMCAENKMLAHLLPGRPDIAKIPMVGIPVSVIYRGKTIKTAR